MTGNSLKSGSLLKHGEYRIESVLGQGGFGITYEAEQVSLGRKVAVKEFFMKDYCDREDGSSHVTLSTSSSSRELVERFRTKFIREAKMIAGLNHPGIVKVFDVFEENGTAYYVMAYLPKGSLSNLLKTDGKLSESLAIYYIRRIASALDYLHQRNILHLDVKPANIMFDEDEEPVLIDFGISKHYDGSGSQTSSTPVGVSNGYAPLEQYNQSDIRSFTPSTDIYSLGATLYYMLRGQTPPSAHDVFDYGIPPVPGVSNMISEVINKSMSPRRNDRYLSARDFMDSLPSAVVKPLYGCLMFDVGYDTVKAAVLTDDGYSILCCKHLHGELDGFYEHIDSASGNFLAAFVVLFTSLKRNCEKITSRSFDNCAAVCPSDCMLPHIFIIKEALSLSGLQCKRVMDRCTSIAITHSLKMWASSRFKEFRLLTVDVGNAGKAIIKEYGFGDGVLEAGRSESVFLERLEDCTLLSNEIYYHKVIREHRRFDKTICIGMKHPVSKVLEFGEIELCGSEDYCQGLCLYWTNVISCKANDLLLLDAIPDEIVFTGGNSSIAAMWSDTTIPIIKQIDESLNITGIVQRRKIYDASHKMSYKSVVLARIPKSRASDLSLDIDTNMKINLINRDSDAKYCVDYRSFLEAGKMNEDNADENTVIK